MTLFTDKAPWVMNLLRADFGLSVDEAAAVLGNIGHECGGFEKFQEQKPAVKGSRGGFGWCQWTADRRVAFEAYCKRNNLDPKSDRANYGYLFVELKSTEKNAISALKNAPEGLSSKVAAFERSFERAGVINMPSRMRYANQALAAWKINQGAKPPYALAKPIPIDPVPPPPDPVPHPLEDDMPEERPDTLWDLIKRLFGW